MVTYYKITGLQLLSLRPVELAAQQAVQDLVVWGVEPCQFSHLRGTVQFTTVYYSSHRLVLHRSLGPALGLVETFPPSAGPGTVGQRQ